MRILSIAYPLTEVGLDAAGGSEQIVAMLDRGLTESGHESLVIAAEGSKVKGTLIASPGANGTLDDRQRRWGQEQHAKLIRQTLANHSVDLVHMHSLDFHAYIPLGTIPVLATLHLPPDWYPAWIFNLQRPNFYLNCVSFAERKACPESPLLAATIPNGVQVADFESQAVRGDYTLALGRICPEKGFHFALDAARQAGAELILAGEVFPYEAHRKYFETEIVPRLDAKRKFLGRADFAHKRELLARAKCLLVPSTVAETSSLVAMEALASGTPLVAFPSGALPEIIENGRTGFLVSSVEEMAGAINAVGVLKPEVCRAAAESRFSSNDMVKRYLNLYESIRECLVRN